MAIKNNKSATPKTADKYASKERDEKESRMALTKGNFKLMLIGFGIIVLGFVLMTGSSNNDPDVYNYSIFSFRRITLAPIVVIFGFAFEIYAIMKRFDKGEDTKEKL